MRVSVIIPCHNAERWIIAALESVGQQTLPPLEVIVIDDSSTDSSLDRIKESSLNIKLLSVEAGNAAVARNAGIEAARGDWIALLDADDIWYPNHLLRARNLLCETADVAFMSNHDWIGLGGEVLKIPNEHRCKLAAPRTGMTVDDYYRIGAQGFHFGHSTVLYRRDRLFEVGMFDATQIRRHDIDLWLRVIADRTWTYDTVTSAGYRESTPGSISKNELECDYYYLRALVKNTGRIASPLYHQHMARQARRAMGIAFTSKDCAHYNRIRELAWRRLPRTYRLFYRMAEVSPRFFGGMLALKRAVTFGTRKTSEADMSL